MRILPAAVEECDRLQAEFDADCDPRRVYVLDSEKSPTKAGGVRGGRPIGTADGVLDDAALSV
jgi:hypothetical protein